MHIRYTHSKADRIEIGRPAATAPTIRPDAIRGPGRIRFGGQSHHSRPFRGLGHADVYPIDL